MRRDTTFARILLLFSILIVVLAAPAVLRQGRFVTDRASDESMPLLAPNSDPSESSATAGSLTQKPPPEAAESLHQDVAPALSVGSPAVDDPAPVSGTSESHYHDAPPPTTLGNPPSQDDASPASEAAQLHKDPISGSGTQPLPDYMHPSGYDWYDWRPNTEIEEVAEPDVHNVHSEDDDFYESDKFYNYDSDDSHIYETVDYDNLQKLIDKVKPKPEEYCFFCWDWH